MTMPVQFPALQQRGLAKFIKLALDFSANETLDPRITFSRTSNATRTNAQGLIEYAPHNLLTYSENFDTADWTKINVSITSNIITAPDGTITADKIIATATSGGHYVGQSPSISSNGSFSFYLKAAEYSCGYAQILDGTINLYCYFDIINNITNSINYGTGSPTTSLSIENVGQGWFKCKGTVSNIGTLTGFRVGVSLGTTNNSHNFTGNGTSGIYLWGAQLNIGSLQPYYTTSVKNLLGYSQNFENAAWAKSNSTIDATPVMGPLDFLGAEKLVEDTATSPHSMQQTAITAETSIFTASLYCKAGEKQYVQLRVSDTSPTSGSRAYATFDLLNGTYNVGSIAATNVTASIIQLDSGWYRCTLTCGLVITGTTTLSNIYIANSATASSAPPTYTGDGTSGIYIFGAQLSDSASLDPYSYNFGAAPTSSAYYGPRFDYDPVTLAPKGLLIEEARTNLLTYSSEFDNAVWTKGNVTIAANTVVAPDGTTTGDILAGDGVSATHFISESLTFSAISYTYSAYLKKGTNNFAQFRFGSAVGGYYANFDLNSGVIGTTNATSSVVSMGNGWYRCSITATLAAATTNIAIVLTTSASAVGGEANTLSTNIAIWGAQLEAGAFPTSYIPTTSAQVTRTADNASMTGTNFSSWYNQIEGTVYSEWILGNDVISSQVYNINDGTSSNYIRNRYNSVGTAGDNAVVISDVAQAILESTNQITTNSTYKNAMAYKQNDFARSSSGTLITDNLGNLPTVNQLNLGATILSTGYLNGHIQSIKYFNKRLLNSYLQSLTQ